ncbi:hypothetical protein ES703_31498 [subsurface metagenome]
MNYRLAKLLSPEDLGAAGTKVIDINVADVISRIDLIFRTKNAANSFIDHPAANITKIELVDGSDVLFSLTGREAQALNFYDRRQPVDNHMTGSNGEWMRAVFGLDFGKYLYDPDLAFDPAKFTNPQLKITFDQDVASAGAGDNYLTVLAHLFDELKPTPTGFLMSKQVYSYTPGANSYEYIDLPTDHPMRKLLIGSHQEARTFTQMVTELKLSEDNDKRVPFDMTGDELFYLMKQIYPEYIENVYMAIDTSDTEFRVTPGDDAVIVGQQVSMHDGLYVLFGNGGLATGKKESTKETTYMLCKGYIPHGVVSIPFGKADDPADWYDVTKVGALTLRLKAGPSLLTTPTAQVITQQLRRYA